MAKAAPTATEADKVTPPNRTSRRGRVGEGRPRTRPEPQDVAEIPDASEIDTAEGDFFDNLKMYDPREWESGVLFMYLYRLAPIIDRERTGSFHNIQKFSRPCDSDEIMRSSYGGSGDYRIILNRFNPGSRRTDRIRDHLFKILNMDFPPRIPVGEWLDHEKNRDWLWAKPQLMAIEKQAAENALKNPAATPVPLPAIGTGSEINTVLAILDRFGIKGNKDDLTKEITKLLERQHAEAMGNKSDPMQMVSTVINAVKDLIPKGNDAALDRMHAELAEERRFNRDLLMKMNTGQAAPQKSILAELKELLSAKEVLGPLFRGRSEKTDWGNVVLEVGKGLIETAPAMVQAFAMGKAGMIPKPRQRPAATAAPGAQQIQDAEIVQDELGPISEEEKQMMIAQISQQFGHMFDEITPMLVDRFESGLTGMHFRDWFVTEYGKRTYEGMCSMDPQTILDVIELRKTQAPTPELRAKLTRMTPPADVMRFIKEFVSDAEATYDDDPAPEAEPSAPRKEF